MLAGVLLWLVEAAGGVVESDGHGFSVGYFALYLARVPGQRPGLGVRHPDPRGPLTLEECWTARSGSGWL